MKSCVFMIALCAAAFVMPTSSIIMPADGSAQSSAPGADSGSPRSSKSEVNWDWTNEQWTGDDDAFEEARAKIDDEFKDVKDSEAAAAAYKNSALDNPQNALDQFRWAYACFSEMQSQNAHGPGEANAVLLAAMSNANQPHCYNFDRLHLLLIPGWAQERSLAERLLKRDPDDIYVKYAYAEILVNTAGNAGNAQALKIAQDMVAAKEDVPGCYYLLAFVCGSIAMKQHAPEYYPKAIAAENNFLSLARNDDPRRTAAVQVKGYLEQQVQKEH